MHVLFKKCNYFKFWYIIFCSLFTYEASSQDTFEASQMKEDLKFLYIKMQKLHPGLYHYQDSLSYLNTYQNLYNSIESPQSYLEFYNALAPLVTDIKDLHTSYTHARKWSKKNQKGLPILIREFDDHYFVAYHCASDSTIIRGDELLEIEAMPMEAVVRDLQTMYGTDNGNPNSKDYYAVRAFSTYFNRKYGSRDSLQLKLRRTQNDSIFVITVASLKQSELMKNLQKKYPDALRKNLNYTLLDTLNHTAKIDVTTFMKRINPLDIFQLGFKKGLKSSFKQVKHDTISTLLLDLRGNGGGYIPIIKRLMKYLSPEPFKLMDSVCFKRTAFFKIFPPYHLLAPVVAYALFNKRSGSYFYRSTPNTGSIKPYRRFHYNGKLIVMMDPGSYSATSFTISMLKDMDRAVFAGERPGGANWGSYAGRWYIAKLPNTKIRVRIPYFKLVHHLPNRRNTTFFVEPDVTVESNFNDFLKRKDTLQESILEGLKGI